MSNEKWLSGGPDLPENPEELETKEHELKSLVRSHAEAIFDALERTPSGVNVPYGHMAHQFADKILALVPAAKEVNSVAQPSIFRGMANDLRDALVGPEAFQNIQHRTKLLQLIEQIQDLIDSPTEDAEVAEISHWQGAADQIGSKRPQK